MIRLFITTLVTLAFSAALAQQTVTMAGVVLAEEGLPEGTRLGVQVLDENNAWALEVASTVPVAGTFALEPEAVPAEYLRPFESGAVLLPGIQNEYLVEPQGVQFTQASLAMYFDRDGNGVWSRQPQRDPYYLALSQVDDPIGFFTLLYVDQDTTLRGSEVTVELPHGWNVFTVRFPASGPVYSAASDVGDVTLEVLDLVGR